MIDRFGLYVHVPWCRTKCPYCDFNSYAATTWPEERYVDALVAELRGATAWHGAGLATVFFGGGTPSLFAPASIARVLETAAELFAVAADAEVTLEANPGTVTVERLRGYRVAGVRRVSFGIQSFQPHVLKVLGRLHTVEDTRLAAPAARAAGFDDVSLDLIFAVPGQSLDDWRADLDAAMSFQPEHVSAYNLTYEEETPFHALRREGRLVPAADDLEAAMFEEARARLAERGYRAYEVSNFARAGHECRHNLNYWTGGAYLGVGAGAHSYEPLDDGGRRWSNEKDPEAYARRALGEGGARAFDETLDRGASAGEFAFLNLRLADGFTEESFRRRFGVEVDELLPGLGEMVARGFVERDRHALRLTPRGLMVADAVFINLV